MAHYPSGTPAEGNIEREDFPGPAFPYSTTEADRKRRWSGKEGRDLEEDEDAEEDKEGDVEDGGRRKKVRERERERE